MLMWTFEAWKLTVFNDRQDVQHCRQLRETVKGIRLQRWRDLCQKWPKERIYKEKKIIEKKSFKFD